MVPRKSILALAIAAVLIASVNQSKADALPMPPVAAGAALSTGAAVTIGFLGVVAVLCLYDVWLKINGLKNWDGTQKVILSNTGTRQNIGAVSRMGGGGGGTHGGAARMGGGGGGTHGGAARMGGGGGRRTK